MVGYFDPWTTPFSLYSHSGPLHRVSYSCQDPAHSNQLALVHPPRLTSPHVALSVLPPHPQSAFVPRFLKFSLPHLLDLVVLFQLHASLVFVLPLPLPLPQLDPPPFVHLGNLHFPHRLQLVASRESEQAWQETIHAQMPLPCTSSSQRCYV